MTRFWLASAFTMTTSCLIPTASANAQPAFDWPLWPRPAVVRQFDNPDHDWQRGHRGIDLRGTSGEAVLAAGDGIVSFAADLAGRPVLVIRHPAGFRTTYEPVRANVAAGQTVHRGDPIGTLEAGHAGCSAPACLHWGLRTDSSHTPDYRNPLILLGLARLRLKPTQQ